ncbi:MAG: hypothetical protein BZY88_10005 [SAR202 cluster bacterium Io17-Chloro-G9]|nr:MAG: hypothetical protein BZY88_10005 [SAR202 cluster bacterium Io17-Chloro-G9]
MAVVDTHCHASPYWFEPVEVLVNEMDQNGVDKAVLIQFRGVFDNTYMIDCVGRYPGRFSMVAIVDTETDQAPQRLEEWVNRGAEGVRLGPAVRSPGEDAMAIWRKAAELGIVVSSLGTLKEFVSPEFDEVLNEFPNLTVIIEHLGGVGAYFGGSQSAPQVPYDEYHKVLTLARYSNTYMKIPGLGEFCPRPMPFRQPMPFADIPPLIEQAVEAFGPQRLMWGSDFPPVAAREGYGNALRFPRDHVRFPSEEDKEWVFGKTAEGIFRFGK